MTDRITHLEVAESLEAAAAEKEEQIAELERETHKRIVAMRNELAELKRQASSRRRAHRLEVALANLGLTTSSPEFKLIREVYERAIQREDLSGHGTRRKNIAWMGIEEFVTTGRARGMKTIKEGETIDERDRARYLWNLMSDAYMLMAGENTKRYVGLSERVWDARCKAYHEYEELMQAKEAS